VLCTPSYAERARALKDEFAQHNGPAMAAYHIEKLLRGRLVSVVPEREAS